MFHIPAHKQRNPAAYPGQVILNDSDDIPDDDPPESWPSEEARAEQSREDWRHAHQSEFEDAELWLTDE